MMIIDLTVKPNLLILCLLLLQYGCAGHSKPVEKINKDSTKGNEQGMIIKIKCQPEVEIRSNDTLVIQLVEYPGTGYSWNPGIDTSMLESLRFVKVTRTQLADTDGAGQSAEFEFSAIKQGVENLRFLYYRIWEKNKPAADSCMIKVIIK